MKRQLIGAWKLLRIEYSGPKGPLLDPFYQAGSTGILIYDSTGWMSVQIAAAHRRAWQASETRLPASADSRDSALKAAAFDAYYAYFGTWELNENTSVLTHHVETSLIPAEDGHGYTQTATLEGGRLVFTNRSMDNGEQIVRRKIWERMVSADR